MLSETSAATVRATLPAVRDAISQISAVFYTSLFAAHPALLRDLFNRGNQANGTQREALAGAFVAYGAALVDPASAPPGDMVRRISHKHASLGVTADQYAIVHTHLRAAVAGVLGDAAAEHVLAAWDEVYWHMAEQLTGAEARLYAGAGITPGASLTDHRVVETRAETDDVRTFLVAPADRSPVPARLPGQYVSVQVELPDGARQIRQYSLTGGTGGALSFAVKRVTGDPDGEVSAHLHDRTRAGDVIRVSAPFGDLTLDEGEGPVLLASAGIGCTPVIGMLDHLAHTASPRHVIAVHADRTPRSHAFRTDLEGYVGKLPHAELHLWYEDPEGPWPAERTGRADLGTLDLPLPAAAARAAGGATAPAARRHGPPVPPDGCPGLLRPGGSWEPRSGRVPNETDLPGVPRGHRARARRCGPHHVGSAWLFPRPSGETGAMQQTILVVDDDPTVAEVVTAYLERAGYRVDQASDGQQALDSAERRPPALVVLDVMLPGMDGFDVCRALRRKGPVPVIMLTALAEEDDRILGLETGADDYVTKPFSPRELVLRIESVLRRTHADLPHCPGPPLTLGGISLDRAARSATKDGRQLALTTREFELLAHLMRNPGVAIGREQLMHQVWGWEFGDLSTVTVHVRRLRGKIEDDPGRPRFIQTVWGVGYRFDAPAEKG